MDRAGLDELDREALIAIILRQQETIERLVADVAELKAQIGSAAEDAGQLVGAAVGGVQGESGRASVAQATAWPRRDQSSHGSSRT